jgi:glycerol kinase
MVSEFEGDFANITGMGLSSYCSALKIVWMLRHEKGLDLSSNVCFGTIDSWLVYKLCREHTLATEVSNASRTTMMNLRTG